MVKDIANSKWNIKSMPDPWKWDADTYDRKRAIVRILYQKDDTFNNILSRLNEWWKALGNKGKWSKNTLSLYLDAMEEDGWITHKKRKSPYSLNKHIPEVAKMLPRIQIRGRVNLDELDAKEFIQNWRNSFDFTFLNIVKDYTMLGKAEVSGNSQDKIQQITQEHIQDIIDIIAFYGDTMVKRMVNADAMMEEEKIREVLGELQKEATDSTLRETTQSSLIERFSRDLPE
jgi:hypothetical protein